MPVDDPNDPTEQTGRTAVPETAGPDAPSAPEVSAPDMGSSGSPTVGPGGGPSVRVDSWVWSVRLTKTRSQAAAACKGGHVRVNGERVKPSQPVKAGDEVRVWHSGRERRVVVSKLIKKRVGAPVAVTCYVDNSPPPPPKEFAAPIAVRPRGAGRPTKRDRRELDRLQGN